MDILKSISVIEFFILSKVFNNIELLKQTSFLKLLRFFQELLFPNVSEFLDNDQQSKVLNFFSFFKRRKRNWISAENFCSTIRFKFSNVKFPIFNSEKKK
jgi:hypothetical protein